MKRTRTKERVRQKGGSFDLQQSRGNKGKKDSKGDDQKSRRRIYYTKRQLATSGPGGESIGKKEQPVAGEQNRKGMSSKTAVCTGDASKESHLSRIYSKRRGRDLKNLVHHVKDESTKPALEIRPSVKVRNPLIREQGKIAEMPPA